MDIPRNDFKRRLQSGDQQIGLWCNLLDTAATELCAGAGFDWLCLDSEHVPSDTHRLLLQLQTVAAYQCSVVVRPPSADPVWIKRALDVGAMTILLPSVESAEQAAAIVDAATFPPRGSRGVASQIRAARWGRVPNYLADANDEVCVLIQIETEAGLENAAEIAAVDGVDGIFIGPADLSANLGHPGDVTAPAVVEAIDHIADVATRAGKPRGILTADEGLANRCLDAGYEFVATGIDTLMLMKAASELRQRFARSRETQVVQAASGSN